MIPIQWKHLQSIRASALASVLPMNIQGRFPLGLTGLTDLFAVQGTLKSLLQHHISKASIRQCSAFFMAQLSHPCMTTGKTIALTIQTFVGKVKSLLFNTLTRFVSELHLPFWNFYLMLILGQVSCVFPHDLWHMSHCSHSSWTHGILLFGDFKIVSRLETVLPHSYPSDCPIPTI